jgi:resuscitation-promoting factor RpfB
MWTAQPPRRPGLWQRLSPIKRAGVIAAALLLPCCGGVTAIGALMGDDTRTVTGTDDRLADIEPITASSAGVASSPGVASEEVVVSPSASGGAIKESVTEESGPKKTVKRTKKTVRVAFKTKRVEDDSLAEGKTRVRTKGVSGIKTLTYEVTYVDGKQTSRRLVSTVVTRRAVDRVVAVGTKAVGDCNPNYRPCVPNASDVDCAGGSGNGPAYVDGPIEVVGSDPYDLDRDGDGIACDS